MLRKYTKKGLEKRKADREGYSEFFMKHVDLIQDNQIKCQECGQRLLGDVSEVCHILPKNIFKSIATLDENIVYLCSYKSANNCHSKFDDGAIEQVKQMEIYPYVKEKFSVLKDLVTERINYKIYDRYED